ncbi:EamA family transporter [Actinospica robiniae]|uniref:EamA family transporter n=1 Tax=Actinospica robiniae TaxID=304901 RepID=UPI0003FDABAC|nr:EamA family transporter [Actinospica robiniae]
MAATTDTFAAPIAAPAPTRAHLGRRTFAPEGRGLAVLLVLGSCSSFQIGAAFATRLFPSTGAGGATLLRLGLAACLMLALTRPNVRAWSREQWRAAVLLGLSLALTNGFFYAAIARIPLGVAVTVQFLGPLTLAAVLSRRVRDLGWVAIAAVGVAILGWRDGGGAAASGGRLDALGLGFALVAGLGWALYVLAGARMGKTVEGRGGLAVSLAIGALALLPFGTRGATHITERPGLVLVAMCTALMGSVVPYTLELSALRRIPRRAFGILLSLEPGIAAFAGWLLLSQRIGVVCVIAIAVVVAASVGSTATAREKEV